MKSNSIKIGIALVMAFALAALFPAQIMHASQAVGEQALLKMRFLVDGPQAQGSGVLQADELSKISASTATATLTRVVTSPASNQIYIRSVLVEKSTGAAGTYTLQYGTGTNCGTGTTVILGPVTNPAVGVAKLGIQVPAGNDLCVQTDAATTLVRILYLD